MTREIIQLQETTSTNDFLKDYQPKADITVAVAQFQSAGRGQRGNTWISDEGKNLMFSILVTPTELKANEGFILSMAKALSLKDVLSCWLENINIKWPNDIYHKDSKMCGTLIENNLRGKYVGRSVIGTGVNINQTFFQDGLAAPATSMKLLLEKEISPNDVLEKILDRFEHYYAQIQKGEYEQIRTLYHNSLYLLGTPHKFQDENGVFTANIHHVEPDGHLVMMDSEGTERRYAFKEVKLVRS